MAVSPGSIMAGFRLFGWLFPARRLEELTSESFETLRAKYRSRDRWGNVLGFFAFAALAAVYYFLLSWLAELTTQRFGGAKYLLRPLEFEFILMGIFLSLVSSMFWCFLALRWFLGRKEYDIYMAYGARRVPGHWHAGRVFTCLFLLFFPLLGGASVLRATMFTAFTPNAMFDSSFGSFGVPDEHPYTEVRNVYFARKYHTRSGDVVSPRYVIVFRDGSQWRTDNGAGGSKLAEQAAMVRYVAEQSRRPVVEMVFAEDIPRW